MKVYAGLATLLTSTMTMAQAVSPSGAAGADATDSSALSEIVVIAQKRSENMQSVPIAITAVTADQLRAAGFTWPPGHEQALIGTAYLICDDLGWGWTPDHIAQHVHANLDQDSVALGQVGSMVNSARSIYCPNQRCWAPHC